MHETEYAKMKFCETFHITPLEYDVMPSQTVEIWSSMKNIEAEWENNERKKAERQANHKAPTRGRR